MKEVTLGDIKNSWSDVITRIEQQNSKVAHFLEEAKVHSFDGKKVLIEIINGHRFHLKTLEKDAGFIEEEMNSVLGKRIKIRFHLKGDGTKRDEIQPQLISPNYCFNCGQKILLKEKEC